MKDLYQTLCNASNLKLLCGKEMDSYDFPLKYPKTTDPKKAKLKQLQTLAQVITQTPELRKESFDPRFDGKHPIELAVEQIYIKGFTKEVVYKILKNKPSIQAKKILGAHKFLDNFITPQYREEIIDKLKEVSIGNFGLITRNGQVF